MSTAFWTARGPLAPKHPLELLQSSGLDTQTQDVKPHEVLKVSDADKTGELEYWEFVRLLREPRKAKISRSDTIGEGVGGVPVFGVKQYVVVLLKLLIWFIGTCVIGFWFVRVVFLVQTQILLLLIHP